VAINGKALVTPAQLRELLEYEKIVKFRDAVFAGTHPTVKLPHIVEKHANAARNIPSPGNSTPFRDTPVKASVSSSHREDSLSQHSNRSPYNNRTSVAGNGQSSSRSEINPILLEKSDDLIKAEIQLSRQRLERALREDIEKEQMKKKAALQTSESLPDFDLAWVLSKALEIVHPSTAPDVEPSVDASASDSFDENTFYSSQHDTPELSSPFHGAKIGVEEQSHGLVSTDKRPTEIYTTQKQTESHDVVMSGSSLPEYNTLAAQSHSHIHQSHLQQNTSTAVPRQQIQSGTSESSSSGDINLETAGSKSRVSIAQGRPELKTCTVDQVIDHFQGKVFSTTQTIVQKPLAAEIVSPLIQAHNLSPVAPQPTRVSPLATARDPPILRGSHVIDDIAPAQVSALRQQPFGDSSANSSPKRLTRSEMIRSKREKKKKRKSSVEDTRDRPDSPYIKPEPRSQSPFAVAPLPRPNKRQRQYAPELNYDEPAEENLERVPERYREVAASRIYEDQYVSEHRRPAPSYQRVESEAGNYRRIPSKLHYDENEGYRRVSGTTYSRRPESPSLHTLPYAPAEIRPARAISRTVTDRRVFDEPLYYQERVSRASVRPDADRERSRSPIVRERRSPLPMGPPRRPVRIIVDEHGREYIDPTPPPPTRYAVAPQYRYREHEPVLERPPPRSVSVRAPVDTYEEDGVIYRRQMSPAVLPRRVVTQPEYGLAPEYRSYRQREYSVRPMAPPGEEYIQIRGAPERRQMSHFEETPREYLPRPMSVRPEPIPVRYEIPREYVGRQSVHPEPPPREYSIRPEARREVIMQPQRDFGVRSTEHVVQREPIPDVERYYEEGPRRPAEVTYIERPRAREASVMVYEDDSRRESMYR